MPVGMRTAALQSQDQRTMETGEMDSAILVPNRVEGLQRVVSLTPVELASRLQSHPWRQYPATVGSHGKALSPLQSAPSSWRLSLRFFQRGAPVRWFSTYGRMAAYRCRITLLTSRLWYRSLESSSCCCLYCWIAPYTITLPTSAQAKRQKLAANVAQKVSAAFGEMGAS